MKGAFEAAPSSGSTAGAAAACPICRRGSTVFFARGRDRLCGAAAGTFALHRCRACGVIFQDPLPDESALAGFYPESYWWSERSRGSGALARLTASAERLYRSLVGRDHVRFLVRAWRASSAAGPRPTLLDIGCGSGGFLALARRRGFVPHGLEPSAAAVAIARGKDGLDVRQGAIGSPVWASDRFDFVTLFHVLEHVRDPRGALEYAKSRLAPGGSLIVQVPNVDSLQARLFGARWYGLDVPRHLINFTTGALERLLEEIGLQPRSVRHFSLRDNPAALASSLAPALDPIGRSARAPERSAARRLAEESLYLALVAAATPLAALESAAGRGATVMVEAKRPAEGGS